MKYRITAPDGKQYDIEGDGTQEEALAHFQAQYTQEKPPAKPASFGQTFSNIYSALAPPMAKEIPDIVGSMGSQVAGSLGGGLNYLGTLAASQDPEAAKAVQEATQQKLSYQPQTGIGKALSGLVNKVAPYVGQKEGEWAGNKVMDLTNSPALATAANLGANVGTGAAAGAGFNAALGALPTPAPRTMPRSAGAAETSPAAAAAQGSPDLAKAVQNVQARGGEVNPEVLQRKLAADSIGVKISEGQATQDPVLISNERNMRAKQPAYADFFNQQEKAIATKLQDVRDQVGPDVFTTTPIDHGETIIDAYKQKAKAADTQIKAQYKALEQANGGQFPVDAQAVLDSANQVLHQRLLYDYAPKEVMTQLQRFADKGDMTFENFESMRTNLARTQRSLSVDGNTKAAAGVIRNTLENLPLTPEAYPLKQLADSARQLAKKQFEALDADPAYKAAVNDTVPADRFVQKFITNGTRDDVATMRKNLAENSTAVQTMGVAAVDHLRQSAGINSLGEGRLSQAAYNRALAKLAPKLNDLVPPPVANSLQTVGQVADWIQRQPAGSFVNNSNTFTSMAGKTALKTAEGMGNYAAFGVPVGSFARDLIERRMARRLASQSLSPEAGLDYQNLAQKLRK